MVGKNFAAIDIGSNSTNLLVADQDGATVHRVVTTTRLGKDLGKTGMLSTESIERTLQCLGE
ncbi:MAG: Ppx/GppA family phosphatase, partial [Actinomycetota bacterium]